MTPAKETWDLVVVGAGPAGSAAAVGALRASPSLRVLLLDRAAFPRDKSCGDGVAPHAIELLARHGVTGLVDDLVPIHRLRLDLGGVSVSRDMRRAAWVVPRTLLDARLLAAARAAGAVHRQHRVRDLATTPPHVVLDGAIAAPVVIGADGAGSVVGRALGVAPGSSALAIRGYAPTPDHRRGEQVIVFGDTRQPSYAWSFDRGDGVANVGYGELLTSTRPPPSRVLLLEQLERLLPGATVDAHGWLGHHLPLSSWRWRPQPGRVLLAGDAAGLVNPMSGEGIYYAVLTGLLAGGAAATAVMAGSPASAGARYHSTAVPALRRHLAHSAAGTRLMQSGPVLRAALRAAAADQRSFDDLVDLGLADGAVTPRLVRGMATRLLRRG